MVHQLQIQLAAIDTDTNASATTAASLMPRPRTIMPQSTMQKNCTDWNLRTTVGNGLPCPCGGRHFDRVYSRLRFLLTARSKNSNAWKKATSMPTRIAGSPRSNENSSDHTGASLESSAPARTSRVTSAASGRRLKMNIAPSARWMVYKSRTGGPSVNTCRMPSLWIFCRPSPLEFMRWRLDFVALSPSSACHPAGRMPMTPGAT
mmetsp:Transcript_12768/g.30194  ORF Transcript_12768/g.30194 Transcript_12768/m.30194 type:complete len:205 (+) Transcript_12768:248-862(+)